MHEALRADARVVGNWYKDEDSLSARLCRDGRRGSSSCWLRPAVELTFIVAARPSHLPSLTRPILSPTEARGCKLVGDVNMFLPGGVDEDGECEIMIACAWDSGLRANCAHVRAERVAHDERRKGYAREALLLLSLPPSSLPEVC